MRTRKNLFRYYLSIALVSFVFVGNCEIAYADKTCIKIGTIDDDPVCLNLFSLAYNLVSAEICIDLIQTATLTVVICEEDSGSVLTVSSFPPVAGNPNQTYVVAAPISPGTYDIFLSMDGYSCLGSFVVE